MFLGATLYVHNAIEAAQFYCKAFRMTIGYNAQNSDGTYLHAELEKNDQSIFAVSESQDEETRKAMLNAKVSQISRCCG